MITTAWKERAHELAALLRPKVYTFIGRIVPGLRLEDIEVKYRPATPATTDGLVMLKPALLVSFPYRGSIMELGYDIDESSMMSMGGTTVSLRQDILNPVPFIACVAFEFVIEDLERLFSAN